MRYARGLMRDALRGYRRRDANTSEAGIPLDPDERRARLARMGTSVGARLGRARVRTLFSSRERRREVMQETALRSVEDVLDVMGNMKGAVMKLAQMASFVTDNLPDGVQQRLASLQQAAPPMSAELVASVVEQELGSPPDKAFKKFDMRPLAAASIGQVHSAVTRDGREVAVKVQYPGVDEAIKADLQNADALFGTVAAMFGGFDPRALVEELLARMTDEFDYRLEARNQQWFADTYRNHAFVKVPAIVPELSAARVLTSELVRGRRFYDVLEEPQARKDRWGEIIFRFCYESINRHGFFSGDPHPGNYIFLDDGRICFLDFGLVKRLETDEEREMVVEPARAVLDSDKSGLVRSMRRLGVLTDDADDEIVWRFFSTLFVAIATDRPLRMTRPLVTELLEGLMMPQDDVRSLQDKLQLPAMLAILNRYTIGTAAVLGHLEAEANWHRIMREIVMGEPASTEVGARW